MRKLLVPSLLLLSACGTNGPSTEPSEPTGVATAAVGEARSYVTGYFALELGGINCGLVQSVDGGDAEGEVVVEKTTTELLPKKHIGNVKYNDFTVKLPIKKSPCTDWLSELLVGKYSRKSGRVLAYDNAFAQKAAREFSNALITEVTFPALDAASKDVAYLTVKFSPETVRNKPGDGSKLTVPKDEKRVTTSSFALAIDGLEPTLARVKKVDALTVKQTVTTAAVGELRDYAKEPGKLEMPNLKITFSESVVEPFAKWHQSFVIDGVNDASAEKSGSLQYLDATGSPVLTLQLSGLGIYKLSKAPSANNEDTVPSVNAEMYVEALTTRFDGGK